jgi:bifunctional isochorismate lyase/aryl carrier protein
MPEIPTIRPYDMPTAADLPVNAAPWHPDPARAVLLVHDLQRYFVDFFPAGYPPVTTLLANVARLRQAAARYRIPVVYSAQPSWLTGTARGLLTDVWGPGMGADPARREIVTEVAPGPGDIVVDKVRYSAFHRTDLAGVLAAAGRDQLLVCGVYAHVGCLMTAADAFAHDIEAFLVADAVADFGPDEHRMALAYAAGRCAVTITTDQLLAHLAGERPA